MFSLGGKTIRNNVTSDRVSSAFQVPAGPLENIVASFEFKLTATSK